MSKIILDLTMTLDGFISGPDGEIDWIVQDESTGSFPQELPLSPIQFHNRPISLLLVTPIFTTI